MLIGNRLDEPVSFPKHDDEWHSFLLGKKNDQVELGLRIKRYVEDLHPSAETFTPSQLERDTGIDRSWFSKELLYLLGIWPVPDHYPGQRQSRYVNPNHKSRYRYGDAAGVCECGIPVLRERFGEKYEQPLDIQEHNDGCCRRARVQARAEMWEKRHRVIKTMTGLGHSFRQTSFRLGFHGDTDHGSQLAKMCGLDPAELQRRGRQRVARTIIVLLRDYPADDIAELYDMSRSALNSIVREETTTDARKLYSHRRRFKKTGSVLEAQA